eukprot:403336968
MQQFEDNIQKSSTQTSYSQNIAMGESRYNRKLFAQENTLQSLKFLQNSKDKQESWLDDNQYFSTEASSCESINPIHSKCQYTKQQSTDSLKQKKQNIQGTVIQNPGYVQNLSGEDDATYMQTIAPYKDGFLINVEKNETKHHVNYVQNYLEDDLINKKYTDEQNNFRNQQLTNGYLTQNHFPSFNDVPLPQLQDVSSYLGEGGSQHNIFYDNPQNNYVNPSYISGGVFSQQQCNLNQNEFNYQSGFALNQFNNNNLNNGNEQNYNNECFANKSYQELREFQGNQPYDYQFCYVDEDPFIKRDCKYDQDIKYIEQIPFQDDQKYNVGIQSDFTQARNIGQIQQFQHQNFEQVKSCHEEQKLGQAREGYQNNEPIQDCQSIHYSELTTSNHQSSREDTSEIENNCNSLNPSLQSQQNGSMIKQQKLRKAITKNNSCPLKASTDLPLKQDRKSKSVNSSPIPKVPKQRKRKIICKKCKKAFAKPEALGGHISKAHPATNTVNAILTHDQKMREQKLQREEVEAYRKAVTIYSNIFGRISPQKRVVNQIKSLLLKGDDITKIQDKLLKQQNSE